MRKSEIFIAGFFLLMLSGIASAAITVAVISPTDLNYTKDSTLAIVFTVLDSNNERNDYNAAIYYGTEQGLKTHLIVNDLNLAAGVEAGAAINCNGTNTAFDTTARTCHYNWDTSLIADANYYIDVNVFARLAGCVDGNCITNDKNADSGSFVLDKTAPTTTITVPTAVRAPGTTVTYTATDTNSPIAKYWVSTDKGVTYIDNGILTTYEVDCGPGQTNWLYLKATDSADNNSAAATEGITCEGSQGTPVCGDGVCDAQTIGETAATCPADCPAVCGDSACTHTESPETCTLDCMGCGDGTCSDNEDCLTCEQDCEACPIEEECGNGSCMFGENPTNCRQDCLPSCDNGICEEATCTAIGCPFGETKTNCPEDCEEGPGPAPECTSDADCATDNLCTTGACINGNCSTVPKANGAFCEFGKECVNAVCTELPLIPIVQVPASTTNYTIILAGAIIVIAAAYFYFTRSK